MAHKLAGAAAAGLSLPRTMEIISRQRQKTALGPIMSDIAQRVGQGESLSRAFGAHEKALGAVTVALVKAGESSGTLAGSLERLADMMDTKRDLQQLMRSALVYPLLSVIFVLGISAFLLIVIVPKFQVFFNELNGHLPLLTQILVDISNAIRQHVWAIPLVLAALIALGVWIRNNPTARDYWDRSTLKIPVIGGVLKAAILARVAATLSTLQAAGLGAQDTFTLAAAVTGNSVYSSALLTTRQLMLEQGLSMSRALVTSGPIYEELALAVQAGEESGGTVDSLARYAKEQDLYVRTLAKALTSTLEPLLIIVLGAIVGTIVVAFYLPEYSMIRDIHP
jgi:type II secretory pathway component PulF